MYLSQLLLLVSKSVSSLITGSSSSNITDDEDYDSAVQNVTFTAGQTSAIANIIIIDDADIEGDEFFVILLGASGLPAGVSAGSVFQASVTIVDNDGEFFTSVFKAVLAIYIAIVTEQKKFLNLL